MRSSTLNGRQLPTSIPTARLDIIIGDRPYPEPASPDLSPVRPIPLWHRRKGFSMDQTLSLYVLATERGVKGVTAMSKGWEF